MRLDTALELSLYLSRETETMAVTQGFQELVPLYKLMEKRDMAALEDRMKVGTGRPWTKAPLLFCFLHIPCAFSRATSWICSAA